MIHFFQELKLKDLHGSIRVFGVSNILTDPTQDLAAEVLRYFLWLGVTSAHESSPFKTPWGPVLNLNLASI